MDFVPALLPISLLLCAGSAGAQQLDYAVVDSGQTACYDDDDVISAPSVGQAFYGQDAQYDARISVSSITATAPSVMM